MDRRKFLSGLIGGIATTAAVRTFPFRVFSFPAEITRPQILLTGSTGSIFPQAGDEIDITALLDPNYFHVASELFCKPPNYFYVDTGSELFWKPRNGKCTVKSVDTKNRIVTLS
jgi:hypothetical protein